MTKKEFLQDVLDEFNKNLEALRSIPNVRSIEEADTVDEKIYLYHINMYHLTKKYDYLYGNKLNLENDEDSPAWSDEIDCFTMGSLLESIDRSIDIIDFEEKSTNRFLQTKINDFVRCIGYDSTYLSKKERDKYPSVEWKEIIDLREFDHLTCAEYTPDKARRQLVILKEKLKRANEYAKYGKRPDLKY